MALDGAPANLVADLAAPLRWAGGAKGHRVGRAVGALDDRGCGAAAAAPNRSSAVSSSAAVRAVARMSRSNRALMIRSVAAAAAAPTDCRYCKPGTEFRMSRRTTNCMVRCPAAGRSASRVLYSGGIRCRARAVSGGHDVNGRQLNPAGLVEQLGQHLQRQQVAGQRHCGAAQERQQ